jgi:hypothetical protein
MMAAELSAVILPSVMQHCQTGIIGLVRLIRKSISRIHVERNGHGYLLQI